MVTLKTDAVEVNAGLRAEHTNQQYTMLQKFHNMGQMGVQSYWDYLPSASVKWMPGEKMTVPLTEMTAYNNTIVNCGWRRTKNKKGGSIWVEKAAKPILVNNLVYDSRFGLKQPKYDKADEAHALMTPNYYYASTPAGVEQMAEGASLGIWYATDVHSSVAGENDPLFVRFTQNPKIDINCEVDDAEKGAPLPFDPSWDFQLAAASPALTGGTLAFSRIFPDGLPFFGMKKVNFLDPANDRNYYFTAPAPTTRFGARF